jgi:hypothetical protein
VTRSLFHLLLAASYSPANKAEEHRVPQTAVRVREREERKQPYLQGLVLPGERTRAPGAPPELQRRLSLWRPRCRPPASPQAHRAVPLSPALGARPLSGPRESRARAGGGGAPPPLHLCRAPACRAVQKAPPTGKVQEQGSPRKTSKYSRQGTGHCPPPSGRSMWFAIFAQGQLY